MVAFSDRMESLLPEGLRLDREVVLHRCFMCLRYVPQHGCHNVKFGQCDIRSCSLDVQYTRSETMANYCAYVCLRCKPNATRLKLPP